MCLAKGELGSGGKRYAAVWRHTAEGARGHRKKARAIGVVRGELLVGNGGVQNHRAWAVPVGGNLLCSLKGRGGRWEGSQRRGTLSLHAR